MMTNDFFSILNEVGRNYVLRKQTFHDAAIWGDGSVSHTDGTVLGYIDHYDLGRELLGLGDLGVGLSRIFLKATATPSVNDLVIDGSRTYKIQRMDTMRFSADDIFIACELSLESG